MAVISETCSSLVPVPTTRLRSAASGLTFGARKAPPPPKVRKEGLTFALAVAAESGSSEEARPADLSVTVGPRLVAAAGVRL